MSALLSLPSSRVFRASAIALSISLLVSGCASVESFSSQNSKTVNCVAGGLAGMLVGAAAGAVTKGNTESIVGGAVIGAAAGCGLALVYKNKLDRLEQLAREENLKMQLETLSVEGATPSAAPQEAGIVAQVEDQGMFAVGSARLSVDGERQVRKLASAFAGKPGEAGNSAILVVGHTDSTGSAALNQTLSEQRARAVASILAEQGIAAERMYFQGAGASRPVADNSDPLARGKNRRVEIVELNDATLLAKRVRAERNNPKYLEHGTATVKASAPAAAQPAPSEPSKSKAQVSVAKPAAKPAAKAASAKAALVDFGGQPADVTSWDLAKSITPKKEGFALISSAYASTVPMSSCLDDSPRLSGEVKNLATGKPLAEHATREYLPGMNGRAWAGLVNGHLVTLSPVAVLRDNATLVQEPKVYVTRDYEKNRGKSDHTLAAAANVYEGEDAILYRVFIEQPQAALSCVDVVLRKAGDKSLDGKLYYNDGGEAFAATYTPVRG